MFTRTMVQDMRHEEVFSKSQKIQPEKHAASAEWTEFHRDNHDCASYDSNMVHDSDHLPLLGSYSYNEFLVMITDGRVHSS